MCFDSFPGSIKYLKNDSQSELQSKCINVLSKEEFAAQDKDYGAIKDDYSLEALKVDMIVLVYMEIDLKFVLRLRLII